MPSASVSGPATVLVRAPAKVNLILRVLDRRSDGYHNLWSLMQTVGLEDIVTIRRTTTPEIRLQCEPMVLAADQTNLVYRAAVLVRERAGVKDGAWIELTKRIPLGAGLGGGSSDAAATILGLNQLFGLGWSIAQMSAVGQLVGSDVPFFFLAPTAIVSGRGEVVRPVRMEGERWVVLVNPGFPVETKWAYQQLAQTRSHVRPLADRVVQLNQQDVMSWEDLRELAENDFEGPVFASYPLLQDLKTQLITHGAESALLSGSGATVFGVFRDAAGAASAQEQLIQQQGCRAYAVRAGTGPLIVQ